MAQSHLKVENSNGFAPDDAVEIMLEAKNL